MKFFLILGLIFVGSALASMPIFRTGYLGQIGEYNPYSSQFSEENQILQNIRWKNQLMFLIEGDAGVEIWNITDMKNPGQITRYYEEDLFLTDFIYQGRYAYGIDPSRGVIQMNSTNLTAIEIVDEFNFLIKEDFKKIELYNRSLIVQSEEETLFLMELYQEIPGDSLNQTISPGNWSESLPIFMEYHSVLNSSENFLSFEIVDHFLVAITEDYKILVYDLQFFPNFLPFVSMIDLSEISLEIQEIIENEEDWSWVNIHIQNYHLILTYNHGYIVCTISENGNIILEGLKRILSWTIEASAVANETLFLLPNDANLTIVLDLSLPLESQVLQLQLINLVGYDLFCYQDWLVNPTDMKQVEIWERTSFSEIRKINILKIGFGAISDVVLYKEIAFIARENDGITILNVSNRKNMKEIGQFYINASIEKIFLINQSLLVYSQYTGLFLFNLSSSSHTNLVFVDKYLFNNASVSNFFFNQYHGILLYANHSISRLEINFNQQFNKTDTIYLRETILDAEIDENNLFCMTSNGNLSLWHITTDGKLNYIRTYQIFNSSLELPVFIEKNKNMLYLTTSNQILTVSLNNISTLDITSVQVFDDFSVFGRLWVDNNFGYVIHDLTDIICFNITDNGLFDVLGQYRSDSRIQNIILDSEVLFVANDYEGFVILNREYQFDPNPTGDVVLGLFLGFGLFSFLISLGLLEYSRKKEQKELEELIRINRYGLKDVQMISLSNLVITLFPYLNRLNFTPEGKELLTYCYYLSVTNNIDPQEYQEGFKKLYKYYERLPHEIASSIAKGEVVPQWELKRLKHEGSFKERALLENNLPQDHPLVKYFNEKYRLKQQQFQLFL